MSGSRRRRPAPTRGSPGRPPDRRRSGSRCATLTLPAAVASLVEQLAGSERHRGLLLDKYSPPGEQKEQRTAIDSVCAAAGDNGLLEELLERRASALCGLGARLFRARTEGPLTLHLARASSLENAGLYLHPVYGFCCLPASGLKGLTRAWAETVWLSDQGDEAQARRQIRAVFGTAAGGGSRSKSSTDGKEPGSRAGVVVFHDAWPVRWPRLEPDIVNNHHVRYYAGDDDPGDWEEPNPVCFLAVAPGAEFDFAVSRRSRRSSGNDDAELLVLAAEWLRAALRHAGAGARTSSGYGRFRILDEERTVTAQGDRDDPGSRGTARAAVIHQLVLATPGFLAGARQEKDDCDLRPATLRGQLRWWWRTMHAGHLTRSDLRLLEAAVWGDTAHGAALALSIRSDRTPARGPFDKKRIVHEQALAGPKQVTGGALRAATSRRDGRTVQGLFYAAYGMDERNRRRWFAQPRSTWNVALTARTTRLNGAVIDPKQVLRQGEAALWLLCRYGAVGAKARKGFGSFEDLKTASPLSRKACLDCSAGFRLAAGMTSTGSVESPDLERAFFRRYDTPWPVDDPWKAMDGVGSVYQKLVVSQKPARSRNPAGRGLGSPAVDQRVALGLPRRMRRAPLSRRRSGEPITRHASPLLWSLSSNGAGRFVVRLTAFPSARLPDLETSRRVLKAVIEKAGEELANLPAPPRLGRGHGGRDGARPGDRAGRRRAAGPQPFHGRAPASAPRPGLPKPRERVEVVLLEEKTKKGGWRIRHEPSGLEGPVQDWQKMPIHLEAGQRLTLTVRFANEHEIACTWAPATAASATPEVGGRRTSKKGRRRRR